TSMPFESRTRAILRSAELGFLGVMVLTCVQTPRLNGEPLPRVSFPFSTLRLKRSAGAFTFAITRLRGFRTSWLIVGILSLSLLQAEPLAGARSERALLTTKKMTAPCSGRDNGHALDEGYDERAYPAL